MLQTLELSLPSDAIAGQYPALSCDESVSPFKATARASGRRELTSQYGAGSAASVISTRTARLR